MSLAKLNKKLLKSIIADEHKSGQLFFENSDLINNLCSDPHKLYSRIDLPNSTSDLDKNFLDKIYLSTMFSDTTKLYSNSSFGFYRNTTQVNIEEIKELLTYYDIIDEIGNKKIINIAEGYFTFTDEEGDFLKRNLTPLFETELLALTPSPNLLITAGTEKKPNFYSVPAEKDYNKKIWRAPLTGGTQNEIPIKQFQDSTRDNEIINSIMIPFISGIPAKEFVKIVEDEKDLLTSFRKEIKMLTKLSDNNKIHSDEMYQDILRPRLDTINSKFKSITQLHSFKVKGATLVTATLSLLSLTLGDYLNAASIMIGVGTGSAGLIKFESDYHNEISNLKNDPMYLLWKLKQVKKT